MGVNMYFDQTKYISNSDLTSLQHELQLREKKDYSKAFNFGHLVEAMIEGNNFDEFAARTTAEEVEKARLMDEAAKADKTVQLFLSTCKKQHEVYREKFLINYNEGEIEIPARGKLDLCNTALKTGGDFKTTAATSQRAFIDSIFTFDYHRAGAWYMDLKGLNRFMFIGISKQKNRFTKKHDVFKFALMRDDENYLAGKRKYSFLAWQYYHLIYLLNLNHETS
jgi:hypothetical protein